MCCKIFLISFLLISVQQGIADLTYRKFVYQKDMSEYCRRRVMPSVFLGRQVVDANSQILHFSRLEVPYSCYITVRTEMGSNIIVVIQVVTDIDLEKSCKSGDSQLLIHEMGETFGGYWGQMPDSVMKRGKSRNDRSYTLKPTPPDTPATTSTTERTTTTKAPPKNKTDVSNFEDEGEYLTMELPIMNVSAKIVSGKMEPSLSFTTEDTFDFIYDVTPRPGVSYDTQVVPLLEIRIPKLDNRIGNRNKTNEDGFIEEFPVQFNDLFTPDPRLILPEFGNQTFPRKVYKYHPKVNRRLDFKKHKNLFVKAREDYFNKKLSFKTRAQQPNMTASTHSDISNIHTTHKIKEKHNYWNEIHDILKILSNTSDVSTEPPHEELANILRGAINKKYNKSVYLSPDLSYLDLNGMPETIATNPEAPYSPSYNWRPSADRPTDPQNSKANTYPSIQLVFPFGRIFWQSIHLTASHGSLRTINHNDLNDTSKRKSSSQDKSFNMSHILNRYNNYFTNNDVGVNASLLPIALDVDSIILNVTNENKNNSSIQNRTSKEMLAASDTTSMKKSSETLPVSLVDHESWENIVNSASVMAVKLNETTLTSTGQTKSESVTKSRKSKRRKKRYLHAIDIGVAQPQHVQKMKHITTTKVRVRFGVRELQRHVEMQDDEIHDRMAMRYLKQYMGPPLLNFCDFNETSNRFVYLFNSSRLVLSISNFTLRRMTVVVTPASTLLDSDARCGAEHLECQVSGARVCIDALCACDGVPNCGSYEIYDEDRLSCGAAAGFRHNVCLAAITFLAVLLTMLYTVHYWLKRCVPKVSDAFFIYTDAAENVLYLDSIMRSPHDMGVGKDFLRGVQELYECEDKKVKKNACKKILSTCLLFLRFRRKKKKNEEPDPDDFDQLYSERISTFAELEIKKIVASVPCFAEAACQTGSNMQMEEFQLATIHSNTEEYAQGKVAETRIVIPISLDRDRVVSDSNQPMDELNMLKFFRQKKERSVSLQFSCISEDLISRSQISSDESKEKEIYCQEYQKDQIITDRNVINEPSQSKDVDKVDISEPKHLRFHEDATVIPASDDEIDKEVLESTRQNKRRSIVFGAKKIYRIQDTNEESREVEEPNVGTGRELKSYFNWGSNKEKKKKKPTKKK